MNTGAVTAQLVGFKRHLRAEVSAGKGAYLFSEHGVTSLRGAQIEALAALLDGTRNVTTVLEAMPSDMAPEQVASLMAQLAKAGLITVRQPLPSDTDERSVAYWDASGIDVTTAVQGTAERAVRLIAVGDVDRLTARIALRGAGLTVTADYPRDDPGPRHADLSVVLCDDYLNPRLADIDAAHRAARRPWLLAKPVGAKVWIGPVFEPAEPGCWHCLAERLWGNRNAEACVQSALGRQGPALTPAPSIASLAATAEHLIALEATKWLAGYRHPGQRAVWTLNSLDLRGKHHELRARPQCATCGDPEIVREQARRPVVLSSRHKACRSGGGHRSLAPDQVRDRYRHLVSPVTGIIKQIRRDPRGPAFFNSYLSGANLAARANRLDTLHAAVVRAESGGKGITPLHAEVSAMCEAIERHSGGFHGDEERIRASLRSLGDEAIHPNACQLYDERQYRSRTAWNAAHGQFQFVCEPLDEHAEIDWTPVWSLTERRHRLLPTGLLYYGTPAADGRTFVFADSNGNAAGSSLEDAVLQGLLELVERDAVALWWYNRTRAPGVDLGSFADPWIDELRGVYAGLSRDVWVLDVTSDLGIPTMVALSRRTDRKPEDIMLGFGAHPDPRVALRRSLTELNQLMPIVVNAGPDGGYGSDEPDAVAWWRHATEANQPYLRPDPDDRPRRPQDYNYTPCQDLLEDVTAIERNLASHGMEVLVLDQTRPDIGLPVVKVIVPGLRPFFARFGPGRLYDVPVRLGRVAEPTRYEDLNPVPMFL